uniref:MULE domain-containing protein n=1 Tax=Panagrellus redivivus TaxID=6233 RepID=A0A7E4ZRE2_PANRE
MPSPVRASVFASSRKGNQRGFGSILEHDHATFHLNKTYPHVNGDVSYYWICSFHACPARATTKLINDVHEVKNYTGTESHSHATNQVQVLVKRAKVDIRAAAQTSSDSTAVIVDRVRAAIPIPVQALLPPKDSLTRTARRVRKAAQNLPQEPTSMATLFIPDDQKLTKSRSAIGDVDIDSNFVVIDTGVENGNNRILGFSTDVCLKFLKDSKHWMLDGTFSITPNLFYQVLVIHAHYDGADSRHSLPCVYLLLPGKSQALYTVAFNALKALIGTAPETAMVDFEKGLHNALSDVFPGIDISGCFFHLSQSIKSKIGDLHLTTAIREDVLFTQFVAMLRALAFVPPEDIVTAFELLLAEVKDKAPILEPLFEYFETYYIGTMSRNHRRRQPLFNILLWNVHNRTMAGHPRTNNNVEGAHNRLKKFLNQSHPPFFTFLDKLRDFLRCVEADIADLEAGKSVGRTLKAWATLENQKKKLLLKYNSAHIYSFLTNVAHCLVNL